MPLEFDCPSHLTATGLTQFELSIRMAYLTEAPLTAKLTNARTGPATRAKTFVKRYKRTGRVPTYAPERANRFIAGTSDAGYGAKSANLGSKEQSPHLGGHMRLTIEKQDAKRKDRLPSHRMHILMKLTNYNEHDTDLALPGAAETTEIVSIKATRALGYAPQIATPALIQLDFKYELGDRSDCPVEL